MKMLAFLGMNGIGVECYTVYLNFRECAIKFNDYFEFPREFDMEPYTVQGLAKIEGWF